MTAWTMLAAWFALSCLLALIIGRAMRTADAEVDRQRKAHRCREIAQAYRDMAVQTGDDGYACLYSDAAAHWEELAGTFVDSLPLSERHPLPSARSGLHTIPPQPSAARRRRAL